jgi:Cdc6-like AAA superfamily ATPase
MCDTDSNTNPDLQKITDKLDAFYKSEKIPHIIFHGSSGTGKQTIVNHFLLKIYGGDKQKIKNNVMTVNCAHGKGIKFIRDDLKFFAKTNIQFSCGVLFKSIVLYNADFLTIDAQSALRRCIEIFSSNTRFFIVVENKNKLLRPILSRFCEIYIPDTLNEDGRVVNLHTNRIESVYDFKSESVKRMGVLQGFLDLTEDQKTYLYLLQLSNRLYDMGYSAEDLVRWKTGDMSPHINNPVGPDGDPLGESPADHTTNLVLVYNKIKSEFRCEKMILFFLLDFLFMRLDKSLNNISYI